MVWGVTEEVCGEEVICFLSLSLCILQHSFLQHTSTLFISINIHVKLSRNFLKFTMLMLSQLNALICFINENEKLNKKLNTQNHT